MKKTVLLVLTFCLLLAFCACNGNTTEDGYTTPQGWKLLSNDLVDYYMIVPENWTTDRSTATVSAYCSSVDKTNVSVMTLALEKPMTVDEYWTAYGVKSGDVLGEVTFDLEAGKLLLHRRESENGVAAQRYTYRATREGIAFVFDQVVSIVNGNVYLITMTATEQNYTDEHKAEFQDMLDYFLFRI